MTAKKYVGDLNADAIPDDPEFELVMNNFRREVAQAD